MRRGANYIFCQNFLHLCRQHVLPFARTAPRKDSPEFHEAHRPGDGEKHNTILCPCSLDRRLPLILHFSFECSALALWPCSIDCLDAAVAEPTSNGSSGVTNSFDLEYCNVVPNLGSSPLSVSLSFEPTFSALRSSNLLP